jgi:hypothetical protein
VDDFSEAEKRVNIAVGKESPLCDLQEAPHSLKHTVLNSIAEANVSHSATINATKLGRKEKKLFSKLFRNFQFKGIGLTFSKSVVEWQTVGFGNSIIRCPQSLPKLNNLNRY